MNHDDEILTEINGRLKSLRRSVWIDYGVFALNVVAMVWNLTFTRWWGLAVINFAGAVALLFLIRKIKLVYIHTLMEKQAFLYASNKIAGMSGLN